MGIPAGMLPGCTVLRWSLGCLMEQRANVRNATECFMLWSLRRQQEVKREDKPTASYFALFVLPTCIFLRVKQQLLLETL